MIKEFSNNHLLKVQKLKTIFFMIPGAYINTFTTSIREIHLNVHLFYPYDFVHKCTLKIIAIIKYYFFLYKKNMLSFSMK